MHRETINKFKLRFVALTEKYPNGYLPVWESAHDALRCEYGVRTPQNEEQEYFLWSSLCDHDSMRECHEG